MRSLEERGPASGGPAELVVLGDHQAAPLIAGLGAGPDVPVHFVSGDADLLSALESLNPDEGLTLTDGPGSAPSLEELRFILREM